MHSVNKQTLLGNVGADPEYRVTPQGVCVASFSLATDEGYKDRHTGSWVNDTEWHNVVIFGTLVDVLEKRGVKKGSKLYLEGKSRTRRWTGNDNVERFTKEVKLTQGFGELVVVSTAPNTQPNTVAHDGPRPSHPSAPAVPGEPDADGFYPGDPGYDLNKIPF